MPQSLCDLRRQLGEVQLLAVSKGQPPDLILRALEAGQRHFAENYLQEARAKMTVLADSPQQPIWHFIGRLQRNKAAAVGKCFSWVHSLDRPELVPLLARNRQEQQPLNVCLQLKLPDQGEQRGGASADCIDQLAEAARAQPGLVLRGLMCMASPDPDRARAEFKQSKALFDELRQKYPEVDTLSMGTSSDWKLAIQCGSTLVRIGQALFGPRTARR